MGKQMSELATQWNFTCEQPARCSWPAPVLWKWFVCSVCQALCSVAGHPERKKVLSLLLRSSPSRQDSGQVQRWLRLGVPSTMAGECLCYTGDTMEGAAPLGDVGEGRARWRKGDFG